MNRGSGGAERRLSQAVIEGFKAAGWQRPAVSARGSAWDGPAKPPPALPRAAAASAARRTAGQGRASAEVAEHWSSALVKHEGARARPVVERTGQHWSNALVEREGARARPVVVLTAGRRSHAPTVWSLWPLWQLWLLWSLWPLWLSTHQSR